MFLLLFISNTAFSNTVNTFRNFLDYGTYEGVIESGEKCSVEVDRVLNIGVRVFIFNPRVDSFEFNENDVSVISHSTLHISAPSFIEGGGRVTNTLIVNDEFIGIQREFCTSKCWTSMTPCYFEKY